MAQTHDREFLSADEDTANTAAIERTSQAAFNHEDPKGTKGSRRNLYCLSFTSNTTASSPMQAGLSRAFNPGEKTAKSAVTTIDQWSLPRVMMSHSR